MEAKNVAQRYRAIERVVAAILGGVLLACMMVWGSQYLAEELAEKAVAVVDEKTPEVQEDPYKLDVDEPVLDVTVECVEADLEFKCTIVNGENFDVHVRWYLDMRCDDEILEQWNITSIVALGTVKKAFWKWDYRKCDHRGPISTRVEASRR